MRALSDLRGPGRGAQANDDGALDEKQRGGAKPVVPPKQKQYRVTKRDELVEVLQVLFENNYFGHALICFCSCACRNI